MKALLTAFLAAACAVTMTACSSRNDEVSSSSSMPPSSSSMMPDSSSSMYSSSGVMSDLEDTASDMSSDISSAITPTMGTDFEKIGALGTTQIPWGAGVRVDDKNRTVEPISLQEKYGKYNAYFIAPEDCGKFYLTFDEGYENGFTPKILDVLKEKNAQAVFFVTMPFAKSQPELIQRMIDEGHVLGNHTNHHWNPTTKTIEEAFQDIQELHNYIKETFDYDMYLYRPPEGAFSEQTLAMAQEAGYTTVLWSFAYKDYDINAQPTYDEGYAKTTKFIHEGAIYLLHAVSKTNTELLGPLIDEVRAQGLEVCAWDLFPGT